MIARGVARGVRRTAGIAVLAVGLGAAPAAQAQSSTVTIAASPNPFSSGATLTLTATVTSGGPPGGCYEWEGCLLGEPLWYVHVSGPNGYYRYHEGEVAWGTQVQFTDSGPGQTLQPATYTATGAVVWPVCTQWVPGWGCFEETTWEEGQDQAQTTATPSVLPVAVGVTPASGAGPIQTFTFQYSSALGETDIAETWQVVHASGLAPQSCVVGFYHPTLTYVLWDDSGTGAPNESSAVQGSTAILENSQCRLHMSGTTASGTGQTLTVVLRLEFTAGYSGPKNVYMWGKNSAGTPGPAVDAGDWTARSRIDTVAPGSVAPGQLVTISGLGFGTTPGVATVNGLNLAFGGAGTSWAPTSVVGRVPAGATSGNVLVWTAGQESNAKALTILPGPTIFGLSPSWGPVGTVVTVTGSNFGATKGTSTVTFNGTTASTSAWSHTSITATVPGGATSGLVKVTKGGVQSPGVPFTVGNEEVVYYTTDGIGSVRMVTTFNQQVVARYDYLPFGEEWQPAGGHAQPVEFAGKEQDQETGGTAWQPLNYFGARYLHSSSGRFTTVDPIVILPEKFIDPQRWNLYSYARNNPIKQVDVDGRYVTDCADGDNACLREAQQFEQARRRLLNRNPQVRAAAEAYGDPGVDNGVVVRFVNSTLGGFAQPELRGTGNGFMASVVISIASGQRSTDLEATIAHEGVHLLNAQTFARSISGDGTITIEALALNLTKYENEMSAYMITHSVFATANQRGGFGACRRGDCILGAGVRDPRAVINQLLEDPRNGYGVTAANPGPRQFPLITTPSNPK